MRFLSPLALAGLAMIALPIAIHMLVRRRAERLDFPSIRFIRETPSFRLRRHRIQQPLLLALRVAAIACLVIGLSRPLFTFGTRTIRSRVIMIDASLSMVARGRTEAAMEQARGLINSLSSDERAAIIAVGTDSVLLAPMTSDKRDLINAIDRYQPTSGVTNYAEGFRAADTLLHAEPAGLAVIDLVSDFQASGLQREHLAQLSSGTQITTHPVGARVDRNAFLVDVEVTAGDSFFEVYASELVEIANERSGKRKSWKIDSTVGASNDIEWRTEPNGQVTARIATSTPDDFDADDDRFLVFGPQRKGSALLIEREGDEAVPYLSAALDATATELGENRFVVQRKASLPGSVSELGAYTLVMLTLYSSPRVDELLRLSDYASAGGTVLLVIGSDVDTAEWNRFANTDQGRMFPFARIERKNDPKPGDLGFGALDADSPALRSMNEQVLDVLRAVRMHEGFTLTPRDGASTIIRWNDGTPAFVGNEVGTGSMYMIGTSPTPKAGELGVSSSFPALTASIARVGITLRNPLAREIGEPIDLDLPPNSPVKIVDSIGHAASARARDLITNPGTYFPRPGIYRVESESSTNHLAINAPEPESETALASTAEIDLALKSQPDMAGAHRKLWFESAEREQNGWRYFAIAAFVLLIIELFVSIWQSRKVGMKAEV